MLLARLALEIIMFVFVLFHLQVILSSLFVLNFLNLNFRRFSLRNVCHNNNSLLPNLPTTSWFISCCHHWGTKCSTKCYKLPKISLSGIITSSIISSKNCCNSCKSDTVFHKIKFSNPVWSPFSNQSIKYKFKSPSNTSCIKSSNFSFECNLFFKPNIIIC